MNVSLPLRAWLLLLMLDVVGVLLVFLGIARDSTVSLVAGGAVLVATSVAGMVLGVLARAR